MDSSLKIRLLTAACCVPILVLVLIAPTPVVAVAVCAVALIGLYEYFKTIGLKDMPELKIIGYIGAVIIAACAAFSTEAIIVLLYIYIIIMFIYMIANKKSSGIIHIAMLIFGLIYIPYFLSNIIYIRASEYGNVFIWFVFIGAFVSDTAAYFSGSAFGKHKLCPVVSPNKTVEGAIGGVIGSGTAFVITGIIINLMFSEYLNGMHLNIWLMFPLGCLSSIVSQIGDLTASSVKRQFNVKDFGTIMPGHGGVLDRFDSVITVAPFIYLVITNIDLLLI